MHVFNSPFEIRNAFELISSPLVSELGWKEWRVYELWHLYPYASPLESRNSYSKF